MSDAETFVTPRRLALVVDGLPERQPEVREERKGPRIDAPQQAIVGFAKSLGIADHFLPQILKLQEDDAPLQVPIRDDLVVEVSARSTGRNVSFFMQLPKFGSKTKDVLPKLLNTGVWDFRWPKSMRWARRARVHMD